MKDYLGNNLNVNDKVVYVSSGYRSYSTVTILRFTPLFVIVKQENSSNTIKQKSNQLIKILK